MILGMSLAAFTILHVVISLLGIASGLVVLGAMLVSQNHGGLTAFFLITTVLTSVTGFFFPFVKLLPSHITGFISLAVLAVALWALYGMRLAGPWRWIWVVTAVLALYLNCFVLVVQLFLKIRTLNALAPTQSEPPFLVAQIAVLAVFFWLGVQAVRTFHPAA